MFFFFFLGPWSWYIYRLISVSKIRSWTTSGYRISVKKSTSDITHNNKWKKHGAPGGLCCVWLTLRCDGVSSRPCWETSLPGDGVSWILSVHSPAARSPQQWVVMNGQSWKPSEELSWGLNHNYTVRMALTMLLMLTREEKALSLLLLLLLAGLILDHWVNAVLRESLILSLHPDSSLPRQCKFLTAVFLTAVFPPLISIARGCLSAVLLQRNYQTFPSKDTFSAVADSEA